MAARPPERSIAAWSVPEAAIALGVHQLTVRRMVADGRLDSVLAFRRRWITTAGIVRVLLDVLRNPSTRDHALARLTALAAELGVPFDPEAVMADAAMLAGETAATPASADPPVAVA